MAITALHTLCINTPSGYQYYGENQVAIFTSPKDRNTYAVIDSDPFKCYPVISFRPSTESNPNAFSTLTPANTQLFAAFVCEPITIYRVVTSPSGHPTLSFSRNVRFDPSFLHWIVKTPGSYVAFYGDTSSPNILPFDISKSGTSTKLTPNKSLPISHLAPHGAWF